MTPLITIWSGDRGVEVSKESGDVRTKVGEGVLTRSGLGDLWNDT